MKLVKPIKNRTEVKRFSEVLYNVSLRDFALFVMGITWGLRISDMLGLTVGDVVAGQGKRVQIVKELYVRERKTGKLSGLCVMTEEIRTALWAYLSTRELDLSAPLFLSREKSPEGLRRPVSRWQVCRVFKRAAHGARIDAQHVGTHTMRKTFGYALLQNGVPIERIMKHLNHSSERETLKYLGIEEEQLANDKLSLKWNIGLKSRNGSKVSRTKVPKEVKNKRYPQNAQKSDLLPLPHGV